MEESPTEQKKRQHILVMLGVLSSSLILAFGRGCMLGAIRWRTLVRHIRRRLLQSDDCPMTILGRSGIG